MSIDPSKAPSYTYSTLEVAPSQAPQGAYAETLSHGTAQPLYTSYDSQAPEASPPLGGGHKGSYAYPTGREEEAGLEVVGEKGGRGAGREGRICGVRKRTFWILLGLVAVVVIGAAVGGGVGASMSSSSSKESVTDGQESPATSANATATQTGTATKSGSAPTSTQSMGVRQDSSLAAIAWVDNRSKWQYRVYYQDENNFIKESKWGEDTQKWEISTLNYVEAGAKPGSPLAAGVEMDFVIEVVYLDKDNLIHGLSNRRGDWYTDGVFPEQYKARNASSLATIWDYCPVCTLDIFLFWQDTSNTINFVNYTRDSQGSYKLNVPLVPGSPQGTSMAVVPFSLGPLPYGYILYYLDQDNDLSQLMWYPNASGDQATGQGWSKPTKVGLLPDPANPPFHPSIAAAAYAQNSSSANGGLPAAINVFNTGPQSGINVWSWEAPRAAAPAEGEVVVPSRFESAKPQVLRTKEEGGQWDAIAAHTDRHVYALKDRVVYDFVLGGDNVTWKAVGTVPTR